MTASFRCYVTDQRLSILEYDDSRNNGRYRAVINEDKVAVIQLQTVETVDTSVAKLSLCVGLPESNVLQLLSTSSTKHFLVQFYIEKVDDDIVYRSRKCLLVQSKDIGGVCQSCKVLLNDLIVPRFKEEPSQSTGLKQIMEEEEEGLEEEYKVEEKASDVYHADVDDDFHEDMTSRVSDDEEGLEDEDPGSDPEYIPEETIQDKPTVIRIMRRESEKFKEEVTEHPCDQCDHKATTRKALRKHIAKLHQPPKYQCPQCPLKFRTSTNLQYHLQAKHDGIEYLCDQCDFKCWTQINLKTHIGTKHGVRVPGRYPCDQCPKIFDSYNGRKHHIESKHLVIKYTCEQCGKQFGQTSQLARHMKSAHEGLRFPCDQCSFSCANKNYLKIHMQTIHEGEKSFLCDQCDYKAGQKATLIQHIETVHKGIRYHCDQCDYKANTKGNLKKHMEIVHSGVKHKCDQCNYQTAQKRVLDTHIKFVHEGIGFTCDICGHKTSTESNLKQHISRKHHV